MDNIYETNRYTQMLNGMNCLLFSYKYILEQYQKEWSYLFAASWSVNDKHRRLHKFVQEKMGFHIEEFQEDALKSLSRIENALNGNKSVIMEFNPYYCPWNLSYLTVNDIHYCIVVAADRKCHKLYCVDRYVGDDIFEWNYDLFEKGMQKIYIVKNVTEECDLGCREIYNCLLNNYIAGGRQIHEEYNELISYFSEAKEWKDLFNSEVGETCRIIILLKQIQVSRLGLSYMFHRTAESSGSRKLFNHLAEAFYRESESYEKINIALYRIFLTKKIAGLNIQKIIGELNYLKESDINIWNKLKEETELR